MPKPGWYYRLSEYFKKEFGHKVMKIPVHAGFTCPNRDGTLSTEGCIFCYNAGFSPAAYNDDEGLSDYFNEVFSSVKDQVYRFIARHEKAGIIKNKNPHENPKNKYLVYYQTYTNTYGNLVLLSALYGKALELPGVVGLSIATRPDCLSPGTIDLIGYYAEDHHVWVEIGLQSASDETLEAINRGHTADQLAVVAEKFKKHRARLCVHIINGLPGEDRSQMMETIDFINKLPVHGIKFHQLQVIRGTPLEEMHRRGEVTPLSLPEYLDIVCSQLERLREDIVVHRLMSEVTDPDLLIAPHWEIKRGNFSQRVEKELKRRKSFQGAENMSCVN